jgi:cytochrome P450
MQRALLDQENLEHWRSLIHPIVLKQFKAWAASGEPVSLFRGMSNLVMTTLVNLFLGPEFAAKHAEEIVPMVRAYESAVQKPETKILPRWMSRNGRFLEATEERLKALVEPEVEERLNNPEKYKNNGDYLQQLLDVYGGDFSHGNLPTILLI